MTKSTGVGRGGVRSGAGRKPKTGVTLAKTERAVHRAVVTAFQAEPAEPFSPAHALLAKAYATLEDVMDNSPFPAPRVTAARAIIDLAASDPAKAGGLAGEGKKVQVAASASKLAGSGKFASPSAPKLVVSNS